MRRFASTAFGRLLVVDPGLQRTLLAARTSLAVALCAGMLVPVADALGQSPTVAVMGVVVALLGALLVVDADLPGIARTCLVLGAGSTVAVVLGVALLDHRLVAHAAFVGIMAMATWGRRYGPRGLAVGSTVFFVYLFTLFLEAEPPMAPWLLGGVLAGTGVVVLVRGVLLRPRPATMLRWALCSLQLRGARLLDVDLSTDTLDDVVVAVRDLLDEPTSLEVVEDRDAARAHLLRIAVTAEHLSAPHARAGRLAPSAPDRSAVLATLAAELAALDRLSRAGGATAGPATPPAPLDRQPPPAPAASMAPETRAAVQVAVAGTLAVAVGALLSPEHWYWAALAVFVVFLNTASRGATLRKAVERTLGTAVGVVAGFAVASALSDTTIELGLGLTLVFLAMWVLQASYTLMILSFTVVLALLYDVLGVLTPDVLALRVAETAVGAALGVAVAMVVLPVRTREHVDACTAALLQAADGVLATLGADRWQVQVPRGDVLAAVAVLDSAHDDLRGSVQPAGGSLPGVRLGAFRRQYLLAAAIRYWVRRLAWTAIRDARPPDGPHDRVRARLCQLAGAFDAATPRSVPPGRDPGMFGDVVDAIDALERLLPPQASLIHHDNIRDDGGRTPDGEQS